MIWLIQNWKFVTAAALMLCCVSVGWGARGWVEDSKELVELRGAEKAIKASMERESQIAGDLEKRLQELKANEKVIEREKIKIVDRPVYKSECLDADGVRIINAAKAGVPGKSAD